MSVRLGFIAPLIPGYTPNCRTANLAGWIGSDVLEKLWLKPRNAGGEVVDARKAVLAVEVLNEDIQELEELVVRAEGEGVRTLQPGEIVGHLDDVLIEPFCATRVGAELYVGAAGDIDLDVGERLPRFHGGRAGAETSHGTR